MNGATNTFFKIGEFNKIHKNSKRICKKFEDIENNEKILKRVLEFIYNYSKFQKIQGNLVTFKI